MSYRYRIYRALEEPRTFSERGIACVLLSAILASVLLVGIRVQYPAFYSNYEYWFSIVNYIILGLFTVEYLVRVVVTPRPLRYVFSIAGLVDLAAVCPSWLGIATSTQLNIGWIRVVRILRFFRALKLIRHRQTAGSLWSGILPRIIPYIGIALLFKLLVLVGEGQSWWFELSKLSTILTVVGFAISLMLGAKLNAARDRMYKIEAAITDIVGDLHGLRAFVSSPDLLYRWAWQLRSVLNNGKKVENFQQEAHDELATVLADEKAPPPIVANLYQQTSFLMLRMRSKTPPTYERFLRHVTIFYTAVVILTIPGLVGLVSTILVVYVLGGMYTVIDDMDAPISNSSDALISADLSALDSFISE